MFPCCTFCFTKALVMHDFTCTQELDWIAYVGIIRITKNIIIRQASLLFSRQIFMQISQHISRNSECVCAKRFSACRLWIYGSGMIYKVRIKAGLFYIFRRQTTGQLIYDGANHLKMCQFFCTFRGLKTATD